MATVACAGMNVFYEERGAGPPLLLIPGTGGHTGTLTAVAERLAPSYRAITYDRRGHSQTGSAPGRRKGYFAQHVSDAAALILALGLEKPIVVGWSWGGLVALGVAVRNPELVQRLVLYEPPLHAKKHMTFAVASGIGGAILLGKLGMPRRGATRFGRFALARTNGTNAFTELDEPTRESLLANAMTIVAELEAGTGEELSVDAIAGIRCPVGLIIGGLSAPFMQAAAARVATALPATTVVRIPDGDHLLNVSRPDELVRAIRECLAVAPASA
jgi:pimeloyl-ACP methyl ester carboxylesterase